MKITADSTQSEQDSVMIYLPSDMYTVKNIDENSTDEFQASMVGIERGATVSTSSNEITFAVDDVSGINSVSINTNNKDTYHIVLDSTAEMDNEQVEVSGTSKGKAVSVSQLQGQLTLNNCEGASVSVNGKNIPQNPEPTDKSDVTQTPKPSAGTPSTPKPSPAASTPPSSSPQQFNWGNVDQKDGVTLKDAQLTLKFALNLAKCTSEEQKKLGDVMNPGDGITLKDAQAILKRALNLPVTFDVEKKKKE